MIPIKTSIPTRDPPAAVLAVLVVNAAVFLQQIALSPVLEFEFLQRFALVPALFEFHPGLGVRFDPLLLTRLVTNTFLHGGVLHLLVNMWTLWLFGRPLQQRLGSVRFLVFYLACGATASLAHLVFNIDSATPALGASGAIAGVLGAFTFLYPRARIMFFTLIIFYPLFFPLPGVIYAVLWFALQLVQGTAELTTPGVAPGIAWWAHIGGFAAGIVFAWLFVGRQPRARADGPRG